MNDNFDDEDRLWMEFSDKVLAIAPKTGGEDNVAAFIMMFMSSYGIPASEGAALLVRCASIYLQSNAEQPAPH